jgi:pseudaminic acid cytidylyltransferase
MKLAVIPARGGSKRIPRKNIKPFCGKPIIAWSIQAARDSGCFDRILVSTDDVEIAQLATMFGAEAPFMRPAELSDDYTGTGAVVAHAIQWQQMQGRSPTAVCCIYATAPFVQPQDLRYALQVLERERCAFVFPVTSYSFPIQRAVRINDAGRVEMFHPEQFDTRSQDLQPAYHDAGQFYWGDADAWLARQPIFSAHSAAIQLPRRRVQDIDTPEDWEHAEWLYRQYRGQCE